MDLPPGPALPERIGGFDLAHQVDQVSGASVSQDVQSLSPTGLLESIHETRRTVGQDGGAHQFRPGYRADDCLMCSLRVRGGYPEAPTLVSKLKRAPRWRDRPIPAHPTPVRILRAFIAQPDGEHSRKRNPRCSLTPGDRLLSGERGGELAGIVYRRAWDAAREDTLTEQEYASPLGRRIYDLRHTCLTTWLNSGVPAAQVAAWAGNSVPVLLSIYVNCIVGDDDDLKRRIEGTLPDQDE
jgi:hypothetical protein